MANIIEMARKNRSSVPARLGGFPFGNMLAAGAGVRFRSAQRHGNATFGGAVTEFAH